MKVVLLIWYSNKNFSFRKIESYLASKIDFEFWKCPIFASPASKCLTRYEQILSGCSLGCKNALNFTCLFMKSTTVLTLTCITYSLHPVVIAWQRFSHQIELEILVTLEALQALDCLHKGLCKISNQIFLLIEHMPAKDIKELLTLSPT